MEPRPRVGVGVLIFKDGRVLLGRRKGSHGEAEYSTPGGHLEFRETIEECAAREVAEETGMEIKNIRTVLLANILKWEDKHYVHVGTVCDWESGEPRLLEPEKCEGWEWYDPERLPSPLFATTMLPLEALRTGRFYFGTIR